MSSMFRQFLEKHNLSNIRLIDIENKLSKSTIDKIMNDIQEKSQNEVYIFTDGSCKGNGKSNAKGACAVYIPQYQHLNTCMLVSEPTNQKAELLGIKNALHIVMKNPDTFCDTNVYIYSDSMYAINCVTKWSKAWLENNWKTTKNQEVKHADIIKEILEYKSHIKNVVKFKHINSHMPAPIQSDTKEYMIWFGNNKADTMAQNEII